MQQPNKALKNLTSRIMFTLFALIIFRVASQIPAPGVNSLALASFFQKQGSSLFGFFNSFSGGALERFSVLALGIMPYITSSIMMSLLAMSFPKIAELQKDSQGYKKISQYSRYLTVLICCVQGFMITAGLEVLDSPSGLPIVINPGLNFKLLAVLSFIGGTMFLMWLGEQITERGLGNGISLIIFAGIAASIPGGLKKAVTLFANGEINILVLLGILLVVMVAFWAIVFIEKSFRKVPVQYAKRVVQNQMVAPQSSHIPIKINISGVMPAIFASTILQFPDTLNNFIKDTHPLKKVVVGFSQFIYSGKFMYNVDFVSMLIFFSFFYAQIQFKSDDIAENLKKNGGFIPGIVPGVKTSEFLKGVVERVTSLGAVYISVICLLPVILSLFSTIPFQIGGTTLLILVGVAIDTMGQIEGHLISQKYENYSLNSASRGRRF